jgi:predicted dienelactone hydrolase
MMSVGAQWAQVEDVERALKVQVLVVYPTGEAEKLEHFGPFPLPVALGAAPLPGRYPLVIVSHGSGGTLVSHRELARYLASRGFIVALIEHPGNNRNDNRLAQGVEVLATRPRDVRLVVDWLVAESGFAEFLRGNQYSLVGHSLGGYTGLALAGGVPTSLPHQTDDRIAKVIEVEADPRLSAVVLLAPATVWFRKPGALAQVHTAILMIESYHDELAPYFYMGQIVLDGVPSTTVVDSRVVERANHYSFLSPWPEALKSPSVVPSQDPPGFDRRRFLDQLYPEIERFLAEQLLDYRASATPVLRTATG